MEFKAMQILECRNPAEAVPWLPQIAASDWSAGQYLHQLLEGGGFHQLLGDKARLLLLTDSGRLMSFCTYAGRDEIPAPELTPWIGFVYTFPQYRGKRRIGKLLEHAYRLAKGEGFPCIYISSGEVGLYEKYGCTFWKMMENMRGGMSRVYRLPVTRADYSHVLGTWVSGTVDRPLGSVHPRCPEMVYPVNYGYVDGVTAGDGEGQDVYILGADRPLQTFSGMVAGVWRRLNDCEDKWIITPDGAPLSREEILSAIEFQEQYYMGELYM